MKSLGAATLEALDELMGTFEGPCGVCDCPPAWALTPSNRAVWQLDGEELERAVWRAELPGAFSPTYARPHATLKADGTIGLGPLFAELAPQERCFEVFRVLGKAVWTLLPGHVQDEFYGPEARAAIGVGAGDTVWEKFAETWAAFSVDPGELKRRNPKAYRAMVYAAQHLCRTPAPETGGPTSQIAWRQQCAAEPGRLLYHVTTDVRGVRERGLLTREELGLERGTGLGGGPSDTVSFTTDKSTAEELEFTLRESVRYLRGELTPEDLVDMARKGVHARRPFYGDLLNMVVGRQPIEGEDRDRLLEEHLDRLRRKVKERYKLTATPIDKLPPGSRPIRYWVGGDGRTYASVWEEPATDEEMLERKWELYNAFLYARQAAGGPENPVFFLTDVARLAQKTPEDIRALTFTLKPGVELTAETAEGLGYARELGMSELRLKSGRMVMPYPGWRRQYALATGR